MDKTYSEIRKKKGWALCSTFFLFPRQESHDEDGKYQNTESDIGNGLCNGNALRLEGQHNLVLACLHRKSTQYIVNSS